MRFPSVWGSSGIVQLVRVTMIDERMHDSQRLLAGERLCALQAFQAIYRLEKHRAIQSTVLPARMQEQHELSDPAEECVSPDSSFSSDSSTLSGMVFPGQDPVDNVALRITGHVIPPEVGHHGHMLGGSKALLPIWRGAVDCANLQV